MKAIVPWFRRAEYPLEQLREEMESVFSRFFPEPMLEEFNGTKVWAPRVDIEELEKELVVKVDLPGVEPKDIEVSVANEVLTIKGEKKEVREEKKKNYHRTERFVGQFYRAIPLPFGVEAEKIVAESAKGVITIKIPKKPEVMPKKVMVTPKE